MTIAAVAARFGVAPQTVHNWLVAAGVPRRPSPATVRRDISDDEIIRLYVDRGLSDAEIAEQLGCSASLVYARLARRGVPRRDRGARHRRRPGDSELARLHGEGGSSLRDLARRYGVSAQAVQRWLIAGGIERRPPGAPRARGVEDPVALYVAGWSAPAIAERLGCSPSTIYRRLDAAGVARRTVEHPPSISRRELIDALETGMAAPAIAARAGVSVSCVCAELWRGCPPSPVDYVFTAPRGGPLRRDLLLKRFIRPPAEAAGLPGGLRLHDLWRTSVSLLIELGAHPKVIQERLGHSSITVTMDVYSHLFPSLAESLTERLDEVFREARASHVDAAPASVVALR